jgi:hypothetical protein
MGGFLSRLHSWLKGTEKEFRKRWWLFPVLLAGQFGFELVKDRVVRIANEFIDAHSGEAVDKAAPILLYLLMNPVAATFIFFIALVTVLVVHAYVETRTTYDLPRTLARAELPLVIPPIKDTPEPLERILVGQEITPIFLAHLYRKNTSVQANHLARIYISKWMRVSGFVSDVRDSINPDKQTTLVHIWHEEKKGDKKPVMVLFYFEKEWQERVLMLTHGQKIKVVGQISDIDWGNVTLEHCELE